ncbi:MAG: tRNA adenosine(34) deaminase TadA [Saccharospirillum sp.]
MNHNDETWMHRALQQAQYAYDLGEVPVGAVLVQDGQVLASGYNQPITALDPSAHAEVVTLRQAARQLGNYRLVGSTLYVTVEPCTMCVGLMIHSRIERLVYGAPEPKSGAVTSHLQLLDNGPYNHRIAVTGGVLEADCAKLMSRFFSERRERRRALKQGAQNPAR